MPSFGGTSAFTRSFRSSADECAAEAWSCYPGISGREFAEETTGSPRFLGNPHVRLPCSVDAGRTAYTRPLQCRSVAPGISKAKAPTKGLSTLNSMAFELAVYASQCGLPTPHARLASSRWSDSTGRAYHPQGSDERFPSVVYISSSSPKLTWRNRIDRSSQRSRCALRCRRTEALTVGGDLALREATRSTRRPASLKGTLRVSVVDRPATSANSIVS